MIVFESDLLFPLLRNDALRIRLFTWKMIIGAIIVAIKVSLNLAGKSVMKAPAATAATTTNTYKAMKRNALDLGITWTASLLMTLCHRIKSRMYRSMNIHCNI